MISKQLPHKLQLSDTWTDQKEAIQINLHINNMNWEDIFSLCRSPKPLKERQQQAFSIKTIVLPS